MPSFALNIPGPGAYSPNYAQRDMCAGHYEMWPQERHAVETRLTATREHYERTAAQVQLKVDADIRRQLAFNRASKSITITPPDTSHMRRPPHAGGPLGTSRDGVPLRSIRLSRPPPLDRRAGSLSACYPTMQPAARPVYPRFSDGAVRPSTTPLTVSRYPSVTSSVVRTAQARSLRILNELYAVARRGEPLAAAPVRPHSRRVPSSHRGLSLAALRAVKAFYLAQGSLDTPISTLATADGQGSLCALTRSSGLSLSETIVMRAEAADTALEPLGLGSRSSLALSASSGITVASGGVVGAAGLVGAVTTLVTGDALGDAPMGEVLDAVLEAVKRADEATLAAGGMPRARSVWLSPLATSPNLLAGRFHPSTYEEGTAERAAREEDAAAAEAVARAQAREVFEYVPPSAGEPRGVCRAV